MLRRWCAVALESGTRTLASYPKHGACGPAGVPAIECVVCWDKADSADAWRIVENLYLDLSDRAPDCMAATATPQMPGQCPWLGVVILPSWWASPFARDAHWLGDAERCLAWAIIDAATPDEI